MNPDFKHEHLLAYALHSWHCTIMEFIKLIFHGPSLILTPQSSPPPWVSASVSTEVILLPTLKQKVKLELSAAHDIFWSTEWHVRFLCTRCISWHSHWKLQKKPKPRKL